MGSETSGNRLAGFASDRFGLVAIALVNVITGLGAFVVLAPLSFGSDVDTFRRGAEGVARGSIATGFLYSPLTGLIATPLTWVPLDIAARAMTALGLFILVVGCWLETPGGTWTDRLLILVAVVGFLPVINELLLGQTTLLIAAAIYPLRDRDGALRGVPLGLALGLLPKPLLLPLLVWMAVRRRKALAVALISALAVTLAGVLLLGPDLYLAWGTALVKAGEVSRRGNLALTSIDPAALAVALGVGVVVLTARCVLQDERRGLVAALFAGLLLAPYTLLYSASILLLAVRPALDATPRASRTLMLAANLVMLGSPIAWLVAGLTTTASRRRWPVSKPFSRGAHD